MSCRFENLSPSDVRDLRRIALSTSEPVRRIARAAVILALMAGDDPSQAEDWAAMDRLTLVDRVNRLGIEGLEDPAPAAPMNSAA